LKTLICSIIHCNKNSFKTLIHQALNNFYTYLPITYYKCNYKHKNFSQTHSHQRFTHISPVCTSSPTTPHTPSRHPKFLPLPYYFYYSISYCVLKPHKFQFIPTLFPYNVYTYSHLISSPHILMWRACDYTNQNNPQTLEIPSNNMWLNKKEWL
jgi:hypothetical protein